MAHRTVTRFVAFSIGLAVAAIAMADSFNLFQPANGILKGSSSTYVTTAAASSDVISLWTSACNNTSYLRGDGVCATPPGSGGGTVNNVALAAPSSIFSVSGSPVTSTGTLTLSYATGQTPTELFGTDGSGNVSLFALTGAYVPPINLASTSNGGITGTLGVSHGGTGAATLTAHGVLVGEGTSAITGLTALSADNVLLGQASADPTGAAVPNCGSGTQALSYSTSTHSFGCQTISAGTGTVTSVGMTAPSVFSISGSPVTSTGTLALSFAGAQTANSFLATPNGTAGAVGLRSIVLPDLPPINLASSSNGGVTGNLPITNLNGGTGASSSTCWFGDGTWKTCGSGGAVTSVGLSLPSVFTVSGSPVTGSGTLSATFTTGLTANQFLATPNGLTGSVGLRAIVAADLPPLVSGSNTQFQYNNSGAFAGTTGITYDNAHSAMSIATAGGGVPSLAVGTTEPIKFFDQSNLPSSLTGISLVGGSGTPVAGRVIWGDGSGWDMFFSRRASGVTTDMVEFADTGNVTINAPSSGATLAVSGNSGSDTAVFDSVHTGTNVGISTGANIYVGSSNNLNIGTTTAATGTLALATAATQRLTIGSTGNVAVNAPSSGTTLAVSGAPNANSFTLAAPNSASQSFGASLTAGTNSSDYNFFAQSAAGTQLFRIYGDGGITAGSPAGSDCGLGCINAQSIRIQNVSVLTTSGNAATATALASTPSQCTGGQFSTGIAASGNANCSTPLGGVSHIAYASISSGCAIGSPSSNVTGCSHTAGTGIFNVTISGFSSTPMCTATTGIAFVQSNGIGSSSTNAQFFTYDKTGATADEGFNFICVL